MPEWARERVKVPTPSMVVDSPRWSCETRAKTLTNPWGRNYLSGDNGVHTDASFTMSWKDFYANFGDVTVGSIP